MELVRAAIFGIIQGLTELLPVSSSGHLAVFNHVFGYSPQEEFLSHVVLVHAGTLLAIALAFGRDILGLFTRNRRLIPLLAAGTVPAGVFGILARDFFGAISANMVLVGIGFLATAAFLLLAARPQAAAKNIDALSLTDAVAVGLAQALAVLPGVSRSGSTICVAQGRGADASCAARFSFLLMMPAVGGATLLDARGLLACGHSWDILPAAVSFAAAFAAAACALKLLMSLLRRGRLFYFSCYLVPLGIAVMLYGLLC